MPIERHQRRRRKTRSSMVSKSWPQRLPTRRNRRLSPNLRLSRNFVISLERGRDKESQEQRAKHYWYHNLQGWCPSNLQGWRLPSSSSYHHHPLRRSHAQLLANSTLTTYHLQGWSRSTKTLYHPSIPRDHPLPTEPGPEGRSPLLAKKLHPSRSMQRHDPTTIGSST